MILVINPPFSIDFPHALGKPEFQAQFRKHPEDFYVEERLGFSLSGQGEHLCLLIEKTGQNTHWVTKHLAEYAGISERDIGVCGRKDRHAVTRQWFSLYDPLRKSIDWDSFSMDGVRLLRRERHHKKLRLGDHQDNHFVIRLRQLSNSQGESISPEQQEALDKRLASAAQGVPNYYGAQRFGRDGNNLQLANDWLVERSAPSRKQRSMVLSAARSYLFNRVLAERVATGQWQQLLEGDIAIEGVPTGPLWGRGRLATTGQAGELEQQVLSPWSSWCERLEHQGLKQERRSLVLTPEQFSWSWQEADLVLSFHLPPGCFATAVLAEVAILHHQMADQMVG